MLRERSIHYQDERRLVRLYKQHAFVFELVQFFVTLMACGFVAGNTLAAVEARSLVINFASEDVTSMIVRSAIQRNCWLVASAFGILACMSMLDSWSLPESLQDLTDPLFRITRELVRGCEYLSRNRYLHRLTISQTSGGTTTTKKTRSTPSNISHTPSSSNFHLRSQKKRPQKRHPAKQITPCPKKHPTQPSHPRTSPLPPRRLQRLPLPPKWKQNQPASQTSTKSSHKPKKPHRSHPRPPRHLQTPIHRPPAPVTKAKP